MTIEAKARIIVWQTSALMVGVAVLLLAGCDRLIDRRKQHRQRRRSGAIKLFRSPIAAGFMS